MTGLPGRGREGIWMKGNRFQGISVLVLLCIGILGWMLAGQISVRAAQKADLSGAQKAVIAAYKNYQKKVDVSAYHLYNTRDSEAVSDMMTEVVNQTPGLFYTGMQYAKCVVVGTNQITGLELEYAKSFQNQNGTVNVSLIQATQKKIDQKVKKALKSIKPGMNTVEKALVLHDYLIQNTQYNDEESKEYRYSEWGVFLKGRGNCQGYSMAYGILMKQAGIPVRYVVSESMMHMWNQIKIDGKWYHVDVTWDDPLDTTQKKDQYGLVLHDRFLCSTRKMMEKGYYDFRGKSAKSTKYDDKFWTDITSRIFYRKGKWLYQTDRMIQQRSSLTKGKAKNLYWAGGNYFTAFNQDKYYFINYNRIYLYQRKTGKIYLVLRGSKYYHGNYRISQLKYASGKLTYRVVRGSKVKTVTRKVRKNGLLAK